MSQHGVGAEAACLTSGADAETLERDWAADAGKALCCLQCVAAYQVGLLWVGVPEAHMMEALQGRLCSAIGGRCQDEELPWSHVTQVQRRHIPHRN